MGRSTSCRSRRLPAQGQCFPRLGSKELHRVLKNCVTLDQFALCIFGILAGRVTLDPSTWNSNKFSPIGLRRSNGVLWWLRQLIRWSASLWAESIRGANTLFGTKTFRWKGWILDREKERGWDTHTERERERVENETDLTDLKQLWTKEWASGETNYEIISGKKKCTEKQNPDEGCIIR